MEICVSSCVARARKITAVVVRREAYAAARRALGLDVPVHRLRPGSGGGCVPGVDDPSGNSDPAAIGRIAAGDWPWPVGFWEKKKRSGRLNQRRKIVVLCLFAQKRTLRWCRDSALNPLKPPRAVWHTETCQILRACLDPKFS